MFFSAQYLIRRFPKLVALLLGLLSASGFAPLNLYPITVLALAAIMALIVGMRSFKAAAACGYWFGVGHFALGLNWIAGSFRYQDSMPVWIGWIAEIGVAFYLALFPMLTAGFAWRWGRDQAAFTLIFAASWIITEWLRATLFTGFAWNPLGVVCLDTGFEGLSQMIGTYGLSGVLCLVAGTFFQLIARPVGESKLQLAFLAALTLISTGSHFHQPEPLKIRNGVTVRIVQPNISQKDKHDGSFDAINFAKLEQLTGAPSAVPRLILWPEAAIPDFLEEEDWARHRVAGLLGPKDLLLTGGDQLFYTQSGHLAGAHNSVFALTSDAKIQSRYDKAHLVPGGEYLPLRWLMEPLGATRLVPGDIDFHEGPGPKSLDLQPQGFGEVGIQICYEIIFSGHVVDPRTYARPDFVFNPSNDAWFGEWGPPQFLAQARLRAIEEGLPVVRATPTGITAIIDADGKIVRALPPSKPGFIEAILPKPHSPTLFARYGNSLPFLFSLLLSVMGIALRRRLRYARPRT